MDDNNDENKIEISIDSFDTHRNYLKQYYNKLSEKTKDQLPFDLLSLIIQEDHIKNRNNNINDDEEYKHAVDAYGYFGDIYFQIEFACHLVANNGENVYTEPPPMVNLHFITSVISALEKIGFSYEQNKYLDGYQKCVFKRIDPNVVMFDGDSFKIEYLKCIVE